MQLCFLGQSYTASLNQVETEITNQTGSFLGRKYTLRRPVTTTNSQLGLRKYRGVAYGA